MSLNLGGAVKITRMNTGTYVVKEQGERKLGMKNGKNRSLFLPIVVTGREK